MTTYTRRIISLALLGYIFLLSQVYAYRYFNTQYYYHPRGKVIIKNTPPQEVEKASAPKRESPPTVSKQQKTWHGYFSAERFENTPEDRRKLIQVRSNLKKGLDGIPHDHSQHLKNIEIRNKKHASRGLANEEKIILHIGNIDTNDEMRAVFTHEMGHVLDLGSLKGKGKGIPTRFVDRKKTILSDDPSLGFYKISWVSNTKKETRTKRSDFVSGYAMSNPFEDFAESYLFYRYHGDKFRSLTQDSSQLAQKYTFMKDSVFAGEEFQTTQPEATYANNAWDATLLPLPYERALVANR